jgi:hypothetical protein
MSGLGLLGLLVIPTARVFAATTKFGRYASRMFQPTTAREMPEGAKP